MNRTQFTFYESFAKALKRIKKKSDKADAYDAIVDYALYVVLPNLEKLPDSAAIAFELIRPTLDASKRKAESGKRGGINKQTASKSEANGKQTGSKPEANTKREQTVREKENEIEKEKENEIENECYKEIPPNGGIKKAPPFGGGVGSSNDKVIAYYANRVNATMSDMVISALLGYEKTMGPDCCIRAIDIALDEKKATWSYINAILKSKEQQGVRCLADWDKVDEARRSRMGRARKPDTNPEEQERRAREDMDRMRRLMEKMNQQEMVD